jgi:PAS domain S-box-containing protein
MVIAPVLALTLYTGFEQRQQSVQEANEEVIRISQLVAVYQEHFIERAQQITFALSNAPGVSPQTSGQCSDVFTRVKARYSDYSEFLAAAPNGTIFCSSTPGFSSSQRIDVSDSDWFQRSLEEQDFVVSGVSVSRLTGKTVLTFGYPAYDSNNVLKYVVAASLDMDNITEFTGKVTLPNNSSIVLIDKDGRIVARYPETERWSGQSLLYEPLIRTALSMQGEEGTEELVGLDGVSRLYGFTLVEYQGQAQGLYVAVGIPTDIMFEQANQTLLRNVVWLAIIMVVGFIAALLGSNFFVLAPIQNFIEATKHIAEGNFSIRIDTDRKLAEIDQLASSFNYMTGTLQKHEENLRKAESRYRSLVEQLPTVIYTTLPDRARTTTYVSPGIEALTGFTDKEWLTSPSMWTMRIHPDDRSIVVERMMQSCADGSPFQAEYRIIGKSGENVWVRDDAVVITNDQGTPIFLQGTLSDITERKEAEEVIQLQEETLREISMPLLRIGQQTMLMPLIGEIDSQRTLQMMKTMLDGVEHHRIKTVILDVTGVIIVDSQVANAILQMEQAIRLLGAKMVITGIRPEVAQTMVSLGLNMGEIVTESTLQDGMSYVLREQRAKAKQQK